jgi:thiol-disulfide isomerase/thioredoxin
MFLKAIKPFCFGSFVFLISLTCPGQSKNQRIITDNKKKFIYTDTGGVTRSYISHFGDTLALPELKTIKGKTILPGDLTGKTVFYNFWFVACRPCVAEIPALNRLAGKYQPDPDCLYCHHL